MREFSSAGSNEWQVLMLGEGLLTPPLRRPKVSRYANVLGKPTVRPVCGVRRPSHSGHKALSIVSVRRSHCAELLQHVNGHMPATETPCFSIRVESQINSIAPDGPARVACNGMAVVFYIEFRS